MPCQLCHSTIHTVARCNDIIATIQFTGVREFMAANPIDLYSQYENLNTLSKPALIVITSRLGLNCSGKPKIVLIEGIIKYYFYQQFAIFLSQEHYHLVTNAPPGPSMSEAGVEHAYARLLLWQVPSDGGFSNLRHRMKLLLEQYYMKTFYMTSYHLQRQAWIIVDDLALAGPGARQVPVAAVAAVGAAPSKTHLKKLKIKIKIDKELQVQECFMCCEEKPNTRLGCSHEYCVDCLIGTAKVRTKSFITCAVCRAEVEEIQVLSANLKKTVAAQIKKE